MAQNGQHAMGTILSQMLVGLPPPPQGRTPWAEVAFWIPTQAGGCPQQCGCLLVIAEGSRAGGQ